MHLRENGLLKMGKILLIDDDEWIRNALKYYFNKKTSLFNAFGDAESALDHIKEETYDVVICDYKLPGMDGITFFKKLQEFCPETIKILITAYGDDAIKSEANQIGLNGFIEKPFSANIIEESVDNLIKERENRKSESIQ